MTEIRVCSDKEEWDEFVLENKGHPLQLWGWGQVKKSHGWDAERIFVYDDEKRVGGAQVLIRRLPLPFRAFVYVPRGPIGDVAYRDDILTHIANRAKSVYHAVVASVEPNSFDFQAPLEWRRSTNHILSPETILLDVTKPESDLLAGMAKKTRQYIRKSTADVTIKQVRNPQDLDVCIDLYKQTAKRAGFNMHTEQYYRDVAIQLRDHSPIFLAYSGENPVAFLWLAISETTAYELYGGVNEEGQTLRANYALKWYAIRKVKEWGLEQYDFGGLVAGGVATFKQGWSSEETEFSGTFDRPLSPLYSLWSKGLPFLKKTAQRVRKSR